ncbi:UNVERIFIED_CONTAM: hypothetical protein Scaly_2055200 [Sesamum calycinum]|uniref:PAR1 protein n=1 Tax=Sesamum calycinum TaxID=2727403 RepID=A0AAW2N2S2_9LAMI
MVGDLICETLPRHLYSFAIASSEKRCILDASQSECGNIDYKCKTSNVMVEKLAGHIENDQCMNACGTDRLFTEGLSPEGSLPSNFTTSICSAACYDINCPGVVDLFSNIAAGEALPPAVSLCFAL